MSAVARRRLWMRRCPRSATWLPRARSLAIANDPGHFRSAAPILLVQGTADAVAVLARTEKLRQTLCSLRDPVAQVIVPAGTHDSAIGTARPQISAWFAIGSPASRRRRPAAERAPGARGVRREF